MADTVRYLMEEMIPELEDLECKGYFSRAEVKAIAQKRQDFEYALKRRAAMKRDFLRYIEYELKVEELRLHRRKARGVKGKKGLAELGIVRRVHFIYERATRKFKADLSLWLEWLAFCKRSKSNKQFSKVVTKALHRHSHVGMLWTEAAAWEFEHTGNVAAARALMQRGLRNCPQDEELWVEYVRLELLYVARLRARRQVLGLPVPEEEESEVPQPTQPTPTAQGAKRRRGAAQCNTTAMVQPQAGEQRGSGAAQQQQEDPTVLSLAEAMAEGQAPAGGSAPAGSAGPAASAAAVRAVLMGAAAGVALRAACAACPLSLPLRARLLCMLRTFDFPGVRRLATMLREGVERAFAADPDAWDLVARWHAGNGEWERRHSAPSAPPAWALLTAPAHGDGRAVAAESGPPQQQQQPVVAHWTAEGRVAHAQCLGVYARALAPGGDVTSAAARTRLRELQCLYLGQRCLPLLLVASPAPLAGGAESRAAEVPVPPQEVVEGLAEVGAQLLAAHQAALNAHEASELVCAQHVDWALALAQPKVAVRAAQAACALHPRSPQVWLRRVRLELQLHARGLRSPSQLCEVLAAAVSSAGLGGSPAAPAATAAASAGIATRSSPHQSAAAAHSAQALPGACGRGGKEGEVEEGSVTDEAVAPLWQAVFEALPPGASGHAALRRQLLAALAVRRRGPATAGALAQVVAALVRATGQWAGREEAARLVQQLMRLPPAGGEVFHAALDVELGLVRCAGEASAGAGERQGKGKQQQHEAAVRRLFEAAVAAYGAEDARLWLRYARWERCALRRGGGGVCWRAGKELADPDAFLARYQEELQREAAGGEGVEQEGVDAAME